ncbi:MAG: hypothetical protein GY835_09735 [bacterium]|nr:hypothetical protein [bacterium]
MVWYFVIISIAIVLMVWFLLRRTARGKEKVTAVLATRQQFVAEEFGRHYFADNARRMTLAIKVRKMMDELLEVDLGGLHPDDGLETDLLLDALDSLASVLLIQKIEEEWGLNISNRDTVKIRTFRDLVKYVDEQTKYYESL